MNLRKKEKLIEEKLLKFWVSLLQRAVIYETHDFFSTSPFWEIWITLFSMLSTTFSYIKACRWMRRNRIWSSLVARWKEENKVEPMRKVKKIFQVCCQTSWKTTSTFQNKIFKFLYHCEDLSEKSSKMYRLLSWESISPRK